MRVFLVFDRYCKILYECLLMRKNSQYGGTMDSDEVMESISRYFPDSVDILVIVPLAIVFVYAVGRFASLCKDRYSLKTNYSRKIFHFIIFTTAFYLGALFPIHRVAAFGAGAGVVVLLLVLFPEHKHLASVYGALAREQDEPHRSYFLIIPFIATAIGGVTTGILFPAFYQVGYLVAGWGDAAGEPVGVRYGKHKYRVPTLSKTVCYRTIEGSIGVFGCSFIAASIVLGSLGYGIETIPLAFSAGLLATLVEAISPHGWDNFTTQVSACIGVFLVDSLT